MRPMERTSCRAYKDLDQNNIQVKVHVHDNNGTINKLIREQDGTHSMNEKWHGARPIGAGMKKIGHAKKWCGKFPTTDRPTRGLCEPDPVKLRQLIDRCVDNFRLSPRIILPPG